MSPETTNTELGFEAHVEVDRSARVHIPLTALGALLGAVVALVATGVVLEGFIVLFGGVTGWLLGLAGVFAMDRYRKLYKSTEELSRDELYAEAQRREIEGRSQMSKQELAEAIRHGGEAFPA